MEENKVLRKTGYLLGLSGAVITLVVYLVFSRIERKKIFEDKNVHKIYNDSMNNAIQVLNMQYRGYHLVLDNKREYYFTIDKVYGISNYKDPLFDYINKGDSVIKNKKSRQFIIKKSDGSIIEVLVFKNN